MKTFLLDIAERFRRFDEQLDVKTLLCNKSWQVFNDSGSKEVYIFQEDGSLIISVDGRVTKANWQYIAANRSLLIEVTEQSYMLRPFFQDNFLFTLQLDGTREFSFLMNEKQMENFPIQSLSDLTLYLQNKEQFLLEQEKRRWAIEQKAKEEELAFQRKQEEERRQKEEKEKTKQLFVEEKLSKILEKDSIYKEYQKKKKKYIYYLVSSIFLLIIVTSIGESIGETTLSLSLSLTIIIIILGLTVIVYSLFYIIQFDEKVKYIQSLREKLEKEYNQTHP